MSEMFTVDKDLNVSLSGEMRFIPEFKELITRDKGSAGDYDGRKKLHAMKELAYVFHVVKHNGPYSNFSPDEKRLRLGRDIFGDENYKPDEKVEGAIYKWKEMTETVSMKVLDSLKTTLYTTYELVNIIHKSLQDRIAKKEYEGVITDRKGIPVSGLKVITEELISLLDVAREIPGVIDVIEKLDDKIKKEESSKSSRVKGGAYVSEREK